MSTVAPTTPARSALLTPVTRRFLWKEYRTLRSLWLAVLALGILLQAGGDLLNLDASALSLGTFNFTVALGAAALYAFGVAATTFSMEHEEATYCYLEGLPTNWLPIFVGKLWFAATSALALVVSLAFTGWIIAGLELPGAADAQQSLGILGFAIVEAIAWGTLFSLLLRQPLLAALLAMASQSLSLTWATSTFVEGTLPALNVNSYYSILPIRAVIVVCVFALDLLIARRWLNAGQHSTHTSASTAGSASMAIYVASRFTSAYNSARRGASNLINTRVLAYLLWQSWRQSWRLMLAMPAIAAFLCFAIVLIIGFGPNFGREDSATAPFVPFVVVLITTALYASAVFHADQRRQSYRFLAEHAVWPRYIWLSRQMVWMLPVAVALVLAMVALCISSYWLVGAERDRFSQFASYGVDSQSIARSWHGLYASMRGAIFGLWAIALGFAIGQACSLLFRRALVAGFVALVCVIPFSLWGLLLWMWELPTTTFVLPIVAGLFAATWLRISHWIVDRNRVASWLKVAAAIAIPVLFVAWRLPAARWVPPDPPREALWQMSWALGVSNVDSADTFQIPPVEAIAESWIANDQQSITKGQRATADRLIRLAEMMQPTVRPKISDEDAGNSEFMWKNYHLVRLNENRPVVEDAVQLAQQEYRFPAFDRPQRDLVRTTYDRLRDLVDLLSDAGTEALRRKDLDKSLEYFLAALSLQERLNFGQPSYFAPINWERERLQSKLVDWANALGQTSARIKRAIANLDTIYPPVKETQPTREDFERILDWTPSPTIVADYSLLKSVIDGQVSPQFLNEYAGIHEYLAFLTGQLPFERERANRVLDYLLINEGAQWLGMTWRLNQSLLQNWYQQALRERGEGGVDDMGQQLRWRIQQALDHSPRRYGEFFLNDRYPPYSWLRTATLLWLELQQLRSTGELLQKFADTEVGSWGLRQQLALVAYRVDHGTYPDRLAALSPDYLPYEPIDAYSGRPFEYRPQGLPLEFPGDPGNFVRHVAPGTPLLWSVGARNASMTVTTVYEAIDSHAEPTDDTSEVRREVYVLRPDSHHFYHADQLVFPLPKSSAAQVHSDQPIP